MVNDSPEEKCISQETKENFFVLFVTFVVKEIYI